MPIIIAPNAGFRFEINCFISNPEHIKVDYGQKSRPKFGLFTHPRKKLQKEWTDCLSEFFKVSP